MPVTDMICILGPTAIGKTRVAVALARNIGGEIISADSRQVYRGMDIGTGKDLSEYGEGGAEVPYHLIDIVDAGTEFNVFEYQRAFLEVYGDIIDRGQVPIICGGTGLYIDSVLKGYRLVEAGENEELRRELDSKTDEELVAHLKSLRPLHNTTDVTDRERLVRAIEIAVASDNDESEPFPEIRTQVFGLRLERTILKQRIVERLKYRLEYGMIEEVQKLLDSGLTAEQLDFYGLEYRFVTQHVTGQINKNDMFQKLREAIYQFARRQEKWFRRMERKGTNIMWLDAGLSVDLLIQQIQNEVRTP